MQALSGSHLAVLSAVAAPAILTNAASLLCVGIGTRVARVVDRTRQVSIAMGEQGDEKTEVGRLLRAQYSLLQIRARHLVHSLRFGYTSMGAFAAEALLAVLGGLLSFTTYVYASTIIGFIALGIGIFAVAAFVMSCTYVVRETMIALDNLQQEAEALRLHVSTAKGVSA
jgi:hypothetical protein